MQERGPECLSSDEGIPSGVAVPKSHPCVYDELTSPRFKEWTLELKENPDKIHRKIWEWDLILDTVAEAGFMKEGFRGLGFAVGQEPLSAVFAKHGCEILATDIDANSTDKDIKRMWKDTNQHAESLKDLNNRGICDPETFEKKCSFAYADMNEIPEEFHGKFDFVWSSCALEHLGSIKLGQRFIINSMKCLKPGGIAIHTTEYNVSSNIFTVDSYFKREEAVIFRRKDLEKVARILMEQGDEIELDFATGDAEEDNHINMGSGEDAPLLKFRARFDVRILSKIIKYWPFVQTSYGIIAKKGGAAD